MHISYLPYFKNATMKTKKTYYELLQDPRWQKRRLEILERDEFMCQNCFSATDTLHVHHKVYLKSLNPWDYHSRLLQTLCKECHEHEHEITESKLVSFMANGYSDNFMYNLKTILDKYDNEDQRDSFEAAMLYFINNKDMMNLAISISNDVKELNDKINELTPRPF